MKSQYIAAIFALCITSNVFGTVPSTLILESATQAIAPFGGPIILNRFQFEGCRFHIDQLTSVDHIGGDLYAAGLGQDRTIFGAIVGLTSPTGFPDLRPGDSCL